jgi:hypothetical protein
MRLSRTCLATLLSVLSLAMAAPAARAQSIHFKEAPQITVAEVEEGLAVTVTGAVSGLGNKNVAITLDVLGEFSTICISPGGNAAPGQNRVPHETSSTKTVSKTEIKNGNLFFTITTIFDIPEEVDPVLAGCPNRRWTAMVDEAFLIEAVLTLSQGSRPRDQLQVTFDLDE